MKGEGEAVELTLQSMCWKRSHEGAVGSEEDESI